MSTESFNSQLTESAKFGMITLYDAVKNPAEGRIHLGYIIQRTCTEIKSVSGRRIHGSEQQTGSQ